MNGQILLLLNNDDDDIYPVGHTFVVVVGLGVRNIFFVLFCFVYMQISLFLAKVGYGNFFFNFVQ